MLRYRDYYQTNVCLPNFMDPSCRFCELALIKRRLMPGRRKVVG